MKLKTIFWAISCLLILLLLLETVYIFGVLKILGTLLTLTLSYIILTKLIGSIKKTRNSITLIPHKWPKYLFILIALVMAFSLYSTLSNKILSQWEETLGLILIFVFILIPTLIILAKTTNKQHRWFYNYRWKFYYNKWRRYYSKNCDTRYRVRNQP